MLVRRTTSRVSWWGRECRCGTGGTYAAHLGQQAQHEALDAIHQAQLVPAANVLLLGLGRPAVHGPLVVDDGDVDEAGLAHAVGALFPDGEGLAEAVAHFDDDAAPGVVEVVGAHGGVVGHGLDRVLDNLDVAAGLGVGIGLLEEEVPVGDAAEELADVDEVEVVGREGPGEADVVDFEAAVGRDPLGLDGRQVGAGDGGGGILVGHVDGPDAGAGAAVEDGAGVLQGREVQLLVERQEVHVVGKVEDLLGQLVVGPPVGAVAVGVVLPPVLHAVVQDGRGQRVRLVAEEGAAVEARVRGRVVGGRVGGRVARRLVVQVHGAVLAGRHGGSRGRGRRGQAPSL